MIINKVSKLRKENNITQGQLANELGCLLYTSDAADE